MGRSNAGEEPANHPGMTDKPDNSSELEELLYDTAKALSEESDAAEVDDLEDKLQTMTAAAGLLSDVIGVWRERLHEEEAPPVAAPLDAPRPRRIIGSSRAMRQVYGMIAQVAPADATVLLRGESGTGKELVAQAIHEASPRAERAFISVNCGALPETLVESELFGHVRGAYTGATSARKGRFEQADGGTLFLDEIGDLPLSLQVKLLRAIQDGEIHRVGDESPSRVDVRVIAATHVNLEDAMEQGTFREDLYYRLNVFPIDLPPLRERRDDIRPLAKHFLMRYAEAHRRSVEGIDEAAARALCSFDWPGNVRQLENCVARAVLLAGSGTIQLHHLPEALQDTSAHWDDSLEGRLTAFEREILIDAMHNSGGILTHAAEALQTTPRILAYRLKKHNLHAHLVRSRRKAAR